MQSQRGSLYHQYFMLRMYQMAILTYVIVWSGTIRDSVTGRELDELNSFVGDWRELSVCLRKSFTEFSEGVTELLPDAEVEFPLVRFLAIFGELIIERQFVAERSSGSTESFVQQLSEVFERIDQLQLFCNSVSDRGLMRRIMTKTIDRLASQFRDEYSDFLKHKFDRQLAN